MDTENQEKTYEKDALQLLNWIGVTTKALNDRNFPDNSVAATELFQVGCFP